MNQEPLLSHTSLLSGAPGDAYRPLLQKGRRVLYPTEGNKSLDLEPGQLDFLKLRGDSDLRPEGKGVDLLEPIALKVLRASLGEPTRSSSFYLDEQVAIYCIRHPG